MLIRLVVFLFLFASSAVALDTVIKGGSMDILEKGEKVFFREGVTLTRGNDVINADEMETTKARDVVKARGNVRLFRKMSLDETLEGFGTDGIYNTKSGQGSLSRAGDRSQVIYKTGLSSGPVRTVDMLASQFDFSQTDSTGVARGNVYGKSIDPRTGDVSEFWSDQATYNQKNGAVLLEGKEQPRIIQVGKENKEVKGDSVSYDVKEERIIAKGNAMAVFKNIKGAEK